MDMISRRKEWIGNRLAEFVHGCKVLMWVQGNHEEVHHEWNVRLSSMFRNNHGL